MQVIGKIWDFLANSNTKNVIVYGGAGAGKSYTVAQFLLMKLLKLKNKHLLITRKTNPSLRLTAYRLMLQLIDEVGLSEKIEHKKAEQIIILPNGSQIIFRGMDDPEKIKSAEFNYVWMEEATEFSEHDYQQLRLRLRRANAGKRNQMYLTFNPISVQNWVYKFFFEQKQDDTAIMHVTYKDNPFLDKEYVKTLKALINQDKTYYEIYTLGKFAVPLNLIYTNWKIVREVPRSFDEIIYGVDFGYNNPTAVIKIGIRDNEIYILDEIYQTRMTNADLIEALKTFIHDRNAPLYCDSAEPNRIEELYRAGFNALASDKSVKDGIDFVKRFRLHVNERCVNFIKEIQNYKWKEDKNGNILDEPVKFMDHLLDAMRYAIYTHLGKQPEFRIDVI